MCASALKVEIPYDNCVKTSGCCSAILNNATAGPLGFRRPCSQSWTVRKLTPIKPANADCDRFNRARMTCGGAGSFKVWVRKTLSPFLNALISWMPSKIS